MYFMMAGKASFSVRRWIKSLAAAANTLRTAKALSAMKRFSEEKSSWRGAHERWMSGSSSSL